MCSKSFYGRGYVNNDADKAAQYIEDYYKENAVLILDSAENYQQEITFSVNTFPSAMKVELDDFELVPGVDYVVNTASSSFHQ